MPRIKELLQGIMLIAVMAATVWLTANVSPASAEIAARPGWVIKPTVHNYESLAQRVADAATRQKIGVIFVASPTIGVAAAFNKKIPGNIVFGLYHPRFAQRMLAASIPAGIEAPIRIYVTENPDGTATLSYKKPSFLFEPYMDEGGADLKALAAELDQLFDNLTTDAAGS